MRRITHKMKKITTWIIICTLGISSLTVQASELQPLKLESAIASAKTYSTTLSQILRQQELNGAKQTAATIEGSYKNYQKQYLNNQYTDKQEEIEKNVIAYDVTKLFDEILLNEVKLKDTENSLKMDKLSLENAKIKLKSGLISQKILDDSALAYETKENNRLESIETINSQYTELCKMMGKSTTHYTLQKDPIVYEPFEIIGNLDGVISSKAVQNLSVWKAIETAKIEEEIDYEALEKAGNSYTTYLELQETSAKAQDTSETTQQQFESTLRSKYTELLQIQEKYKIQEKGLQLLEKQLQTKEKQYEAGYVSKTAYETSKLSCEQAKTALLAIVVQQEYIKQVVENPYLL